MALSIEVERISSRFADRLQRLGSESAFQVFSKAKALEAQGRSIVHFEIGEPDFDTPRNIIEAGKKALDNGFTHYAPAQGYLPFREAVVEYAKKYKGISCKKAEDAFYAFPNNVLCVLYILPSCLDEGRSEGDPLKLSKYC